MYNPKVNGLEIRNLRSLYLEVYGTPVGDYLSDEVIWDLVNGNVGCVSYPAKTEEEMTLEDMRTAVDRKIQENIGDAMRMMEGKF